MELLIRFPHLANSLGSAGLGGPSDLTMALSASHPATEPEQKPLYTSWSVPALKPCDEAQVGIERLQ